MRWWRRRAYDNRRVDEGRSSAIGPRTRRTARSRRRPGIGAGVPRGAKLFHLEPDAAFYLERFVEQFKGKFYVKDVLQKLSWHYYLQGDQSKASHYRNQILSRGATATDADQQALKEARSSKWPNKLLLQARLLNDGGISSGSIATIIWKKDN